MGSKSAWTPERREKQREAIKRAQPWLKSTGPKTSLGKARSSLNRIHRVLATINVHEANRLLEADPNQWITIRRDGAQNIPVRTKGWSEQTYQMLGQLCIALNRIELDRQAERNEAFNRGWTDQPAPYEERTEQEFDDGRWTAARRAKQANAIQRWKPWEQSTGPRTAEGKDRSAQNTI